jgi:hypothetical protein
MFGFAFRVALAQLAHDLPVGRGVSVLAAVRSQQYHSTHLQLSEQVMPAWKHSQYFFMQPDFLQAQPLCVADELVVALEELALRVVGALVNVEQLRWSPEVLRSCRG